MSSSMWSVARRPRWIAALFLALGVAAAFAGLGQWQLERSFASGEIVTRETEATVPLTELAEPQGPVAAAHDGQLVSVEGTWVPDDTLVLSERYHDDDPGFWLVGHLTTVDGAGLAVALGWSADEDEVTDAAAELEAEASAGEVVTIEGRYVMGEAPQNSDFEAGELSAMAPAAFANLWSTVDEAGIYGGYVIADGPAAGLTQIDAPPPPLEQEINWLNIFYAAEWAIFAGFAIFLWWRLVKDAWEVEEHERQEAAAAASA
ncbi:SURF1 family protein [Salinibacterium sp. GXW1014]|uniref:SURF1 family protein n=1 Tax=Salinibacterium sp. GXW1014 TaxID=3377838 RepID=UPI00383B83B0